MVNWQRGASGQGISTYFRDQRVIEQGEMQVIEAQRNALVRVETVLRLPDNVGRIVETTRQAASNAFRLEKNNRW